MQSQRSCRSGRIDLSARNRRLRSHVMLLAVAGSAAATLLCSHAAMAQSMNTWSGASGTDTNWSTAGNWSGGGPPANTDSLFYNSGVTNLVSTNNDTGLSLTAITFGNGAGAYVLNPVTAGSNAIALTGALTDNTANTSTETINFAINGTSTSSLVMSSDTGGPSGIGGAAGPILALNANDSFGSMAISNNSATVPDALLIGAGNTVTINGNAAIGINSAGAADNTLFNSYLGTANTANNGTGGTLTINGNLTVGGGNTNSTSTANKTVADLSALSAVNIVGGATPTTLAASTLWVGTGEHDNGILILASGANSSNSINVGTIAVGDSIIGDAGNDNATPGRTLTLGSGTNTIEANVPWS